MLQFKQVPKTPATARDAVAGKLMKADAPLERAPRSIAIRESRWKRVDVS